MYSKIEREKAIMLKRRRWLTDSISGRGMLAVSTHACCQNSVDNKETKMCEKKPRCGNLTCGIYRLDCQAIPRALSLIPRVLLF